MGWLAKHKTEQKPHEMSKLSLPKWYTMLIIQINILNNKSSTQVQPRDQVTKNCMFQRASSDAGLGGMMRVAHSTMGGQLMDGYLKCIRCFVYLN